MMLWLFLVAIAISVLGVSQWKAYASKARKTKELAAAMQRQCAAERLERGIRGSTSEHSRSTETEPEPKESLAQTS
jgi:hypothetical protein